MAASQTTVGGGGVSFLAAERERAFELREIGSGDNVFF